MKNWYRNWKISYSTKSGIGVYTANHDGIEVRAESRVAIERAIDNEITNAIRRIWGAPTKDLTE